jgi:D-alanyl-lipoteichoic acid acyltransferase DltB (MBOAT superfamily)
MGFRQVPAAAVDSRRGPVERSLLRWERCLPPLLLLAGAGTVALAVTADLLAGRGAEGFGSKQMILVLAGVTILVQGGILALPKGQRHILEWLGTPADVRRDGLLRYTGLALQLGLLVLVIRQFQIESPAFYDQIALFTLFGFLAHHPLPFQYRLPFFLFLSLAGICTVFGPANGAWLVGIGLVLIGICHLPISFAARVAAIAATGGALAFLRTEPFPTPWSQAVWPILASMFMFRLIVYLYDLRHSKEPVSVPHTLSYFFLLPNVLFPLFPVVDYATSRRTYYDADAYWIYQRGVQWIFRGVVHLILYRFVYEYLTLSPSDVATASDLVRYLLANFLLYLRISGLFHLVVGMLHLFGFHLPETNHRYYLASSFTDFWRRINIYWKDFMMKVVYYPAYFKLRRWGAPSALVLSTLLVFFATWLLHSYQWFWLLGSVLLSWTDVLFWATLGLLLVANSLYETRHGRKRSLAPRSLSVREAASVGLRTAGTFVIICILWSLWTSPSLGDWLSLWSVSIASRDMGAALVPAVLVATVAAGAALHRGARGPAGATGREPVFLRSAALTGGAILFFYLAGSPVVSSQLGDGAQQVIADLQVAELNKQDADLLQRGYYENLLGVSRFNSQLREVYTRRPPHEAWIWKTEAGRETGDFLGGELRPSAEIVFHGAVLRTNRWGMRDRDYEREKPPGVYRIALLGSSVTMGWGVEYDETFEQQLEERLNSDHPQGASEQYEILNFAGPAYAPPQYLLVLERKALSFSPDAVFVVGHPRDERKSVGHLATMAGRGIAIPWGPLRDAVRKAGVGPGSAQGAGEKKLKPYGSEILSWVYRRIAADARARGAIPAWILIPTLEATTPPEELARLRQLAADAGFTVLDLSDVYHGRNPKALQLAEWDWHPNARAHKLIADRLYRMLKEKRETWTTSDPR